jgi:hypothetical protein
MGYDLHITRKEFWYDDKVEDITLNEWLEIVNNDPDLIIYGKNGPGFACWKGTIENALGWIDYSDSSGCLYSKYPDDALITKMVEIAMLLGAKVQGDDGEVYVSSEEILEWQAPGVWKQRKR